MPDEARVAAGHRGRVVSPGWVIAAGVWGCGTAFVLYQIVRMRLDDKDRARLIAEQVRREREVREGD